MIYRYWVVYFSVLVWSVSLANQSARAVDRPNIVYILADDLGYGDVRCLNPNGKIATPHVDRLAAEGLRFSDAHSSSSVCTPTRYGILTGRYCWRGRLKASVLEGFSPPLIETGRLTVAELLKQRGYATACIGKWHLGLDLPLEAGDLSERVKDARHIDYTRPIANGPTSVGFDYFFGISASLDMPPFIWIENDQFLGVPTVEKTFLRKGPAEADFEAVDVLPRITSETVNYIRDHAARSKAGEPFFIYFALNSPHTPIVPSPEWQGKSGLNPYADFVMQTDATVGSVLAAIDETGLADQTLVVFTSDNGCSPMADFKTLRAHGHDPSSGSRGTKSDIWEGGHRIPLVMRWPKTIPADSVCSQTVCLTDFMATAAEIVGAELPCDAAEDSVSLLASMREPGLKRPVREATVFHSINGSFAIQQGRWKLILCPDSGGWSDPKPGSPAALGLPSVQLYDISVDRAETTNVQDRHPELVEALTNLLNRYRTENRSVPARLASSEKDGASRIDE